MPGFSLRIEICSKLFVEVAGGAGDVYAAGDAALAVLDPLHDAGGLAALGTIGALGRVHYLLAVCCLGDFSHGNSVSSSISLQCFWSFPIQTGIWQARQQSWAAGLLGATS